MIDNIHSSLMKTSVISFHIYYIISKNIIIISSDQKQA